MNTLFELDAVGLMAGQGMPPILDSITLRLYPGEFVALVGPAGAGKSSLFKLMNRLRSASSGAIYFNQQAIATIPVCELRQQVMLAGQDSRLLGMTARQALHYPLILQKLSASDREARVADCLERLQLPQEWLNKTELELSGGQQQQIAIAPALVMQPQLLLLDEPTAAPDLGAAHRILAAHPDQAMEPRLTVVISHPQLEIAQTFGYSLLYLEHGRLLQDQAASTVDWQHLRETLLKADAQVREDWGDDSDL